MSNQNHQQAKKKDTPVAALLDTNVTLDPTVVGYNIETRDIEEFIVNYLKAQSIDGVEAARVRVDRAGDNPKVTVYAFISDRSKDLTLKQNNLPPGLQAKIDTGGQKPSERLNRAVRSISKNVNIRRDGRNRVAFFDVDIFRVLGIMLASDPRVHQLNIPFVSQHKRGVATITVFKSLKFVDRGPQDFDKYSRIAEQRNN